MQNIPQQNLNVKTTTPETTEIDTVRQVIGKLLSPFEGSGSPLGLAELATNKGWAGVKDAWQNRVVTYKKEDPLDAVLSDRPKVSTPTEDPLNKWLSQGQSASVVQSKKLNKNQIKFQESNPGYRGMPYVDTLTGTKFLDEIDYTPPAPKQRITKIEISDPRDATAKPTERQGVVITDPEQLEVANIIKAVADDIAPEYTDYLLRLAWYEGRYNPQNRLDNGERGVDRGIFQINSKSFPDIPDDFADDPVKATLWAISAIEAGKQKRWVADKYVRNARTNISYE